MPHVIVSIRIHEAVHQRLTIRAQRLGVTVSDLITHLLDAAVGDELIITKAKP